VVFLNNWSDGIVLCSSVFVVIHCWLSCDIIFFLNCCKMRKIIFCVELWRTVVVLWNDIYLIFQYLQNFYSMKMSYELTIINTNVVLHTVKLIPCEHQSWITCQYSGGPHLRLCAAKLLVITLDDLSYLLSITNDYWRLLI
jgi:hypothetical protein